MIWPDHDDAGAGFAKAVQRLASDVGAAEVRVVQVPADFPVKWDLANKLPDGWTVERGG